MKQREMLFIVVSFFGLVLLYFAFSIYHNYVTSTIPEDLNIQIAPISPNFDEKTISDLKKRGNVSPLFQTTGFDVDFETATQEASPSSSL